MTALPAIATASEDRTFAEDVRVGLGQSPKRLPCKYFYDAEGSQLFDAITELDAYYPTRTETAIMREHAGAMAAAIGPRAQIIELGSGSSIKTRLLLDELEEPAAYVPVDISAEHLEAAAAHIAADYPELEVTPVAADFTRGFELPTPAAPVARRVVYFPGSTIGNFDAEEAHDLLAAVARLVGANGALLLGFDLVKDADVLERAYDDGQGITAQFNLNLLARINRELDGNFDLDNFEHEARWVPESARIEIHIRSLRDQVVRAAGQRFRFREGEAILTEYSHKYTRQSIRALAKAAGLGRATIWTDPDDYFGVGLFWP